jgi:hypothetical protein
MQSLLHAELIETYVRDTERRRIAHAHPLNSGALKRLRIGRGRRLSDGRSLV